MYYIILTSGTEPKIKIYYGVSEKTLDATEASLKKLQDGVLAVLKPLLET